MLLSGQRPTDCRARNLILVAESHGFRREPDLHPRAYDEQLYEDAAAAHDFLDRRHPETVEVALARPEVIGPAEAAERIVESGRVTLADAERIIKAAEDRGFAPATSGLPLLAIIERFDQCKAAVAYFWGAEPEVLNELLGDRARLAPTPDDAWIPCPTCGR